MIYDNAYVLNHTKVCLLWEQLATGELKGNDGCKKCCDSHYFSYCSSETNETDLQDYTGYKGWFKNKHIVPPASYFKHGSDGVCGPKLLPAWVNRFGGCGETSWEVKLGLP